MARRPYRTTTRPRVAHTTHLLGDQRRRMPSKKELAEQKRLDRNTPVSDTDERREYMRAAIANRPKRRSYQPPAKP